MSRSVAGPAKWSHVAWWPWEAARIWLYRDRVNLGDVLRTWIEPPLDNRPISITIKPNLINQISRRIPNIIRVEGAISWPDPPARELTERD